MLRSLIGILALMSLTAQAQLEDGTGNDLQATVQHSYIVWQAQAGDHLPELAALFYPGQPAIQAFWLKKVHEFNPNLPMDLPLLTAQELLIPDLAWLANQAIPKIPSTLKTPPDLTMHYDQLQRRNAELQRALAQTLRRQAQLERQLDDLRLRLEHTASTEPANKFAIADTQPAQPINVTPKTIQLPDGQKVRRYKMLGQTHAASSTQALSFWQMLSHYWLIALVVVIGLVSIGGSIWLAASHKRQIVSRQQAVLKAHAELTRPERAWSDASKAEDEKAPHLTQLSGNTDSALSEVLTKSADLFQRGQANQALQVLEDWVAHAPRQSVYPWLFLLACNEAMQQMQGFSEVVEQMHLAFGLAHNTSHYALGSSDHDNQEHGKQNFIVQQSLAHIWDELNQIWLGKDIGFQLPIEISGNRSIDHARQGFSVGVLREVTVLQALLELQGAKSLAELP